MAAPVSVTPDTLITIKLQYAGVNGNENKRTKLPLKDLVPGTLPAKLRSILGLPADQTYTFERFSDSAGAYVKLDDGNAGVYKQLHRAAKAKLKLRLRIITVPRLSPAASTVQSSLARDLAGLQLNNEPTIASAQPNEVDNTIGQYRQEIETTQDDVAQQLTGLKTLLSDFADNLNQDYTSAFGRQLPNFIDAPAEPEMPRFPSPPFNAFSVCCNKCNFAVPDHHWHCGICQEGDFDLCEPCLQDGNHCDVPDHYLVKRTLDNGKIVSSTTETFKKSTPAPQPASETPKDIPGAFTQLQEDLAPFNAHNSRTCNSCISIYDDSHFVTCKDCDDFDLCLDCHIGGQHGHHPAHTFAPAVDDMMIGDIAAAACEPGRNESHDALCDGCDAKIIGVRHKCLDCPDWDFCTTCHRSADFIHSGHRFVPIYEALPLKTNASAPVHYGIRCDGPLCDGRRWIVGDRYKCAVCHDTDFCANCEAVPSNAHSRTHPLIKLRTPVRDIAITTMERLDDQPEKRLGDRDAQTSSRGTETTPLAPSVNAATQAQSDADEHNFERAVERAPSPVLIEDIAKVDAKEAEKTVEPLVTVPEADSALDAYYVRDYVPDGTSVLPGSSIYQTWTMLNPKSAPWPVGCALRWIGGASMLDVDTNAPGSLSVFERAATSNATVSEVTHGVQHAFSVKLRAPEKIGRAVSYWRLYTPDGLPFGHRLWVDCNVVPAIDSSEPKAEKEVEAESVAESEAAQEVNKDISESQMVFPKLEKESPASSTHELPKHQTASESSPIIAEEAEELLSHDDVESVAFELDDDETTDDGFLTDEDYDMVEDVQH